MLIENQFYCKFYKIISKINRVLLRITAIIFAVVLIPLYLFKRFTKQQNIKPIEIKDIEKVYILNIDRNIERRKQYENNIKKLFGGDFFGKDIEKCRFCGTDGGKDLTFTNLQTNKAFTPQDLSKNSNLLTKNVCYKVEDNNNFSIKYQNNKPIRHMTIGEFGCLFSHLRAIKDILDNNYKFAIILEDDFEIDKNFILNLQKVLKNCPDNAELLKLDKGSLKESLLKKIGSTILYGHNKYLFNLSPFPFCLRIKANNATGYIISNKMAKKIIDYVNKNTLEPTDTADHFIYSKLLIRKTTTNAWVLKKPLITFFCNAKNESTINKIDVENCVKEHRKSF